MSKVRELTKMVCQRAYQDWENVERKQTADVDTEWLCKIYLWSETIEENMK